MPESGVLQELVRAYSQLRFQVENLGSEYVQDRH
jgi:hypothetical protein